MMSRLIKRGQRTALKLFEGSFFLLVKSVLNPCYQQFQPMICCYSCTYCRFRAIVFIPISFFIFIGGKEDLELIRSRSLLICQKHKPVSVTGVFIFRRFAFVVVCSFNILKFYEGSERGDIVEGL
jgi:hypothetical protein